MDRWYLIPPSLRLPFCVRIHHIKKADIMRPPHNHPYTFASIVLRGWYSEERIHVGDTIVSTDMAHAPFEVYSVEAARYHRIAEVSDGGVWTMIIHPRKPSVYEWGFLLPDGTHVPHAELKERRDF